MIYEYPESFVVPVVYDKNLNPMNRDWEDMWGDFFDIKDNLLQKPDKGSMYNDCIAACNDFDDEAIKEILSDIDNEYANSETM